MCGTNLLSFTYYLVKQSAFQKTCESFWNNRSWHPAGTISGSNKPNTLSTNWSLIYNGGRAINQWCEIHANDSTESNKTSAIISHLNNVLCFFFLSFTPVSAGTWPPGAERLLRQRSVSFFKMLHQRRLNRTQEYIVLFFFFFNGMRNCIFFPPECNGFGWRFHGWLSGMRARFHF